MVLLVAERAGGGDGVDADGWRTDIGAQVEQAAEQRDVAVAVGGHERVDGSQVGGIAGDAEPAIGQQAAQLGAFGGAGVGLKAHVMREAAHFDAVIAGLRRRSQMAASGVGAAACGPNVNDNAPIENSIAGPSPILTGSRAVATALPTACRSVRSPAGRAGGEPGIERWRRGG